MTIATTEPPATLAPKLLLVLKEGYGWRDLQADLSAGLTVAVVALPLSMALAIASGTTPDKGLVTAVVAGFTMGIAIIIGVSQLPDALGLHLPKSAAEVFPKLAAIAGQIGQPRR